MKITITGGGEVGYHLAKMLASDSQDIYLIDNCEDRLAYAQSHLDVYTVHGDAKSLETLTEAKVDKCDLLIAVTSSEETNLLISILGKKLGAKRSIARIDSLDILDDDKQQMFHELGVDTLISPVQLATDEIVRLISKSAFTDEYEFEDGKLIAFGIAVCNESPLINKSVKESAYLNPNRNFKPIAIHRGEQTLILNGDTVILRDDIVYFVADPETCNKIIELCGKETFSIKDMMILGGSDIGVHTAQLLEEQFNITLIERDAHKCEEIAKKLKKTLVINVDGSDVEALKEEGLAEMDAFISVTGDSETNILASLVAKNHGVKKTIARVENIEYLHLSHNIGIDSLINKKIIAAGNIFRFVRKGDVDAVANLHSIDAEIIEFTVKANSKVTHMPLKEMDFPENTNVAGVIRDEKGFIPFGDFQLQSGDKALVFTLNESVHDIEDFFL